MPGPETEQRPAAASIAAPMAAALPSARGLSARTGRRILTGIFAVVAVFLLVAPGTVGSYTTTLITTMLIYGIFTMSLDLLVGYTGLPSFGHAAFFGTGGYLGAEISLHISQSVWVDVGLATLGAGAMALIVGAVSMRVRGTYFVMVTLAIAQLLYSFASSGAGHFIGGSDGLPGVSRPTLAPLPITVDFYDDANFYYLVLVVAVIAWLVLRGLVRAPLGAALEGIRENETRMRAIGYVTWRYRLAAFVIAGMVGGAAGSLFALQRGYISPEVLSFSVSGFALIMLLIGGTRTLLGGFVGAAVYVYLQDSVSSSTDRWQLIFGVIFIAFMFLMRDGVVGTLRRVLTGGERA